MFGVYLQNMFVMLVMPIIWMFSQMLFAIIAETAAPAPDTTWMLSMLMVSAPASVSFVL